MNQTHTLPEAARVVTREVLALRPGEQFLIVTNPGGDAFEISRALYDAATEAGAEATLVVQPTKTQLDFANLATVAALGAEPQAFASVSENKLGKDRLAAANPYVGEGDKRFDHAFDWQLYGKKTMRAVWTPGITVDMFRRTAGIDYGLLQRRCEAISNALEGAESVRVTSPGGTNILVPVTGRKPFRDDGDFTAGGSGGNVPAGEVFISPLPGRAEGLIVFDGSISLNEGDMIVREPVTVAYKGGFITEISGGKEADLLRASVEAGRQKALEFEAEGKIPAGSGAEYAKNAGSLGELGIGLNPAAEIRGNMLEDEKAFHTCHFAIGSNYDNDAEAMIHLDCLVRNPTITVNYPDGTNAVIEQDGILVAPFGDIQ